MVEIQCKRDNSLCSLVLFRNQDVNCTYQHLLPRLDDARVDEFHDVIADGRVLHMILQGCRIGLSLLQDGLHDRIAHDFLTGR